MHIYIYVYIYIYYVAILQMGDDTKNVEVGICVANCKVR